MFLRSFMCDVGSQEVNIHLMADRATRQALLVDAGGFEVGLVELAAELELQVTHILITHLHYDHVDAVGRYLQHWPNVVVVSPGELTQMPGVRLVTGGDAIQIGPFTFDVLLTSGHTGESVSYYCAQAGVCFTGDALFAGSVGGTSDEAHYQEQLDHLKCKIMTLPESTEILSGHGPASTVAIERAANPFLQPGFGRTG